MKKLFLSLMTSFGIFFMTINPAHANAPTDCGLSSFVVDGDGIGAVANFVINISTSLPTYALGTTSGTLNCEGITSLERQEIYVLNTYDQLTEEAAMGEGPHLEALAVMVGCSKNVFPQFNSMVQNHFHELVQGSESTKENATYFIHNFHVQLQQSPDVLNQCHLQ